MQCIGLIDSALALIQPAVMKKGLACTLHYDGALPAYVAGDAVKLTSILLHLLSNAVKFTKQGGIEVTVTLSQAKGRDMIITLAVSDTGIGIPNDKLSMIFDRFTRVSPVYQGTYPGMGLGLTSVKQAIAALEGEVHVDSTLGEGSTFTCVLPFKEALLQDGSGAVSVASTQAALGHVPEECAPVSTPSQPDAGARP